MKLRLTFLITSVLLLITTIFIPNILISSIPNVGVTKLSRTVYNQYLNCTGSIEQEKKTDISLDIPVMISHLDVEIGDYVKKGQRVAVVDKDATLSAFSNVNSIAAVSAMLGDSISGVPTEILSEIANSGGTSISDYIKQNKEAIQALPNTLKAPESGIVTIINAVEGEMTSPLNPIISIVQTDNLVARVSISETSISKIKEGQIATLSILAQSDSKYYSTVSKIYPTAKKTLLSTGQDAAVDVILKIDNADYNLKPGYTAKAKIVVAANCEAYILPYEAICQDDNEQEFVYVYEAGRVRKRNIETKSELLTGIEVIDGLGENEIVISNPTLIKRDNQLVRLANN